MALQQTIEGRWNEVIGRVRSKWHQLSEDDLKGLQGNVQQLILLIERKTGEVRDRVESQLMEWAQDGENVTQRMVKATQSAVGKATDTLQSGYDQVTDSVRTGYRDAERTVQQRPVESVAVAFGAGLIAGVLVGVVLKAR